MENRKEKAAANPVVRKIQKLLRLADNQSGEPEGESAARLAAKLMRAHAIKMADLSLEEQQEQDPLVDHTFPIKTLGWYAELMWVLAEHCGVAAYRVREHSGTTMRILGHRTDVEVIEYLYQICLRQIEEAYAKHRDFYKSKGYKLTRGQAISYKTSAVWGLDEKLIKIRTEAQQKDATGTAMVLSRGQAVTKFAESLLPNVGTFRASTTPHNDAGYQAGKAVNLSTGLAASSHEVKQIQREQTARE